MGIGRALPSALTPPALAVGAFVLSAPTQVATWMLLPPGTATGTWTAMALAVAGTAVYAVAGPRR
ncbi:hypothetical protein [Streptomyces wuyuanensis]|uniref:hypothetical protein n=1 Tax=Streptomyces wuyuanensis TaxID=1196353 RepID=UPI00341D6163